MFPPVQDVLVLFLRGVAVAVAIFNNRAIVESAYTHPRVIPGLSLNSPEDPNRLVPASHADNCDV